MTSYLSGSILIDQGIWVFPYDPSLIEGEGEAGPSRRKQRPLKEVYSSSLQAYRAAYEVCLLFGAEYRETRGLMGRSMKMRGRKINWMISHIG